MSLDLQALIEKLNPVCRRALEKSAELCVAQTHYNVEIEHLLIRMLEADDSDFHKLLRHHDVRTEDLMRELHQSLESMKRGNSRTPALSPQIIQLLEQAWLQTTIHFGAPLIRTAALACALLDEDHLRALILRSAPSLKQIPRSALRHELLEISRHFAESDADPVPPGSPSGSGEGAPGRSSSGAPSAGSGTQSKSRSAGKTEALDQYTIDLARRAAEGKIDPIQERDLEIRQIIDILTRRRQNNPILTGDAGVGKTAVVEGLALRVAAGDVPPPLKQISLRLLDLGLLQAGAGIKGEFEKRLKSVIDEVTASVHPVILFIDEAHTMIGAGAPAGMGDAANMLKPALARGELRTIAATTWSEYKKYFEKDPALARRFQVVDIKEPEEDAAVNMLRGVVSRLESHHGVRIIDEALVDAVHLSLRYITGRRLPDKAVSVLDTACARVSLAQNTVPVAIEELTHRIEYTERELESLHREANSGASHEDRIRERNDELGLALEKKSELESRWKTEKRIANRIMELTRKLDRILIRQNDGDLVDEEEILSLRKKLLEKQGQLAILLDTESPMVPVCVDGAAVADVISDWTGIPVRRMMTDEIDAVLTLNEKMQERIIGQPLAVDAVCRRIRTYRARMDDPGKPVGVFLLVGPSGVGKTETAVTLSELLYGGEHNLISLNMSEYQEAYTVSGLKGSPPGYVGHGQGGVLTEAVRRNPYSVVLLDEVEKAHPDVMELFYQVFDKGVLEDSEGVRVDFKNTLILLTTNMAGDTILKACHDPENLPDADTLTELIRPELSRRFNPAFLGRMVIVPYYRLGDRVIQHIVRLKLSKIQERFREMHRIELTCSESLIEAVSARCTSTDTGARNVDHILTHYLLPELSGELLRRMAAEEICTGIHVFMDETGNFAYRFEPEIIKEDPAEDEKDFFPPKHLFRLGGETEADGRENHDEEETERGEFFEEGEEAPSPLRKRKRSRLRDLLNRL